MRLEATGKSKRQRPPLHDNQASYPITGDNMSIESHPGPDVDDVDDQHLEVGLKVSLLMIRNGMQPPWPLATISVGNRAPSTPKFPRVPLLSSI